MATRLVLAIFVITSIAGCSASGTNSAMMPNERTNPAPGPALLGQASPQATPKVEFYDTPSHSSWPDYIISGPQGALWFTEFYTAKVGKITTTGKITEFPLPQNNDIEGIAAGPDGNIWFTEPGAQQIGRMTPSGHVTAFPITGSNPSPRGITAGPDGNLWYVEYYDSYIGRVTPSGTITRFQIPGSAQAFPWDITTGADGDLWFTESATNQIGRFNPQTLKFDTSMTPPTQSSEPWGILLTADKHIWFTERAVGRIAVVNGTQITEFKIPGGVGTYPEKIAEASNGKLWFTEMQAGKVGSLNPATGKFGAVITLSSGSIPIGIATGPDKNIWFCLATYTTRSQIGEIKLR
jgi:streptogramin lyase